MSRLARIDARVGSYRLADLLGAGGMGEVYRAIHVVTGRVVAIKVFSAHAIEAHSLARFYHEARVQHSLTHPNIVRLHEIIDLQGRPCLVMEYVDGESLAERIRREGRLPSREALRILQAISGAVAHVHADDIVHRDLKPANIRITRQGIVKLLDFGIAKSRHVQGLTQTGKVIGTPRYLAPEQMLGERITRATDVWALGVLLYEMTTGRPPFSGDSPSELWAQIDTGTYAAPSSVLRAASDNDTTRIARIDRLVADCLARDPARRPSAERLAAAAAEALTGHSGVSQPRAAATQAAGRDATWNAAISHFVHAARAAHQALRNIVSRAVRFEQKLLSDPRTRAAARRLLDWLERRWLPITSAAAGALVLMIVLIGSGSSEPPARDFEIPPTERGVHRIDVVSGRAKVLVNGRPLGETPIDYVGRLGDTVAIELRQAGFETLREQVQITTTGTSTFNMRRPGELR